MSTSVPRNPFVSPRFGQVATFMLLPTADSAKGLDVALLGIPYDGGTSYRTGARFGPRAVVLAGMALASIARLPGLGQWAAQGRRTLEERVAWPGTC